MTERARDDLARVSADVARFGSRVITSAVGGTRVASLNSGHRAVKPRPTAFPHAHARHAESTLGHRRDNANIFNVDTPLINRG